MITKNYNLNEAAEETVEWIMDIRDGSYNEEEIKEFITESERFENSDELIADFDELLEEIDNRIEYGYY